MWEHSVFSVLAANIIAFVAGTAMSWPSPELENLNSTDTGPFNGTLTSDEGSWIVATVPLGCAFGPFIFGYLANSIGRKYTLLSVSLGFGISYAMCAFGNKVAIFIVARAITGLSVGGIVTVFSLYVGEMSLDHHRGILGSAMTVSLSVGVMFTYIVGNYMKKVLAFNLLLVSFSAAGIILFFFLGTESPHYYVEKKQYDKARQVLRKIRAASDEDVDKELEILKGQVKNEEHGSIMDIFKSRALRKALIMGSGCVFFQQISGVNAVLSFASTIFAQAGSSLAPAYCSMVVGGCQLVGSFFPPILLRKFGRKTLLLNSAIGMTLSEGALGIYEVLHDKNPDSVKNLHFLPIVSMVLYILTLNAGFSSVPWVVIGEVFPPSAKFSASGIATMFGWLTSFVITKWFGAVGDKLGQGVCFLGFAGFSFIGALFVYFFVMETKGKSLAEIQEDLSK